jgi:hypothetical protein
MFVLAVFCAVSMGIDGILMLVAPRLYCRCLAYLTKSLGWPGARAYGLSFFITGALLAVSLRYLGVPAVYYTVGFVLGVCGLCLMFLRGERRDFLAAWWVARPSWLYRLGGIIFILSGAMVLQGLAAL